MIITAIDTMRCVIVARYYVQVKYDKVSTPVIGSSISKVASKHDGARMNSARVCRTIVASTFLLIIGLSMHPFLAQQGQRDRDRRGYESCESPRPSPAAYPRQGAAVLDYLA
ncbi:uncharacterized protein LOC128877001 [Hylaeus volcanicus]|uniref:uncharacterized protein LOC128877001 n=1 Tax=Hylaeus volcanicus TaxID=313075 RepID=UPI0023B7A524|nr:uncharacterized protein LOC128877001 [Hylaeus volcanicus]